MFKTLILAIFVAVSFAGAILASAAPAAAADDYDAFDSNAESVAAGTGGGACKIIF